MITGAIMVAEMGHPPSYTGPIPQKPTNVDHYRPVDSRKFSILKPCLYSAPQDPLGYWHPIQ